MARTTYDGHRRTLTDREADGQTAARQQGAGEKHAATTMGTEGQSGRQRIKIYRIFTCGSSLLPFASYLLMPAMPLAERLLVGHV